MAVSSGFFDAVIGQNNKPDRKYSADQFGAIFDGIITDGVFEKYPSTVYNPESGKWEPFKVTASENLSLDSIQVDIGPGRAWLDKTWTLNDSTFSIELEPRNVGVDRLDGIYIKVDKDNRQNSIVKVTGDTSSGAIRPSLNPPIDTVNVKHYLIATVLIKNGGDTDDSVIITDKDIITNMVGLGGVPFVESNVTDISITTDTILNNLESKFDSYRSDYSERFDTWFQSIKDSMGELTPDQIIEIAQMVAETYCTDYLSGGYPYEEDSCLYLSSDKKPVPSVIINFGFVSGPMANNPNANEITVETSSYTVVT